MSKTASPRVKPWSRNGINTSLSPTILPLNQTTRSFANAILRPSYGYLITVSPGSQKNTIGRAQPNYRRRSPIREAQPPVAPFVNPRSRSPAQLTARCLFDLGDEAFREAFDLGVGQGAVPRLQDDGDGE